MKKLVILALALITFQANAQDKKTQKKDRLEKRMQLEPQEKAELQTKKMTLHLDLTESQQKKVMSLNLKNAEQRKAAMQKRLEAKQNAEKTKPTKEQKLEMAHKKLDAQIATKKEMKAILNAEQYEKWEKSQVKRQQRGKKMKKGKKKRIAHKKELGNEELNKD